MPLVRLEARHLEREAHVFFYGHVGIQRVALEHHGHAAISWVRMRRLNTVNGQFTRGDVFKASNHAQGG